MPKPLKHALDDRTLRSLVAKREAVAKADGDGLTFTLSAAGTATWVMRYRIHGRRPEITIGNYPDIPLAEARRISREIRAQVDRGIDPATVKQQERARAVADWTVRELIVDFKEKRFSEVAPETAAYREIDLDRVIGPALNSRPVRSVSPADIIHMIESAKATWSITKRILSCAKQLFAHACGKRLIDANPCHGIEMKALMGPRPPVRKRIMLTEVELQVLLRGIDQIGTENALALRILLATCVRGGELVMARWEHVDMEIGTWRVPVSSVKTRVEFVVPLTPTVIGWFQELKDLAGNSEWVLPSRRAPRRRRSADGHVGKTTLWAAITRAFLRGDLDIRRFTPHDTRSTAKGHMRNIGISREISEIALNHKLKGMEAVYDVREEIPERRVALEKWAAFLVNCESGRTWNVVPMRKPA